MATNGVGLTKKTISSNTNHTPIFGFTHFMMINTKSILCCLFISILMIQATYSQLAFNYYNQRNHPELKWFELETNNFRIIYHPPLKTTAHSAAQIAEDCYQTIVANLGHKPTGKIPIYISDQDEIANGFDLSNRYIVIWVNINNYFESSTGPDKWLRKVIAHELVHYIHFCAISTWLGFIGHGFTRTPRWFIEGLAQYESETWNVHRGDLILRTRVIEDEMDYSALCYPSDGAMLYATGNSAVRYMAATYGDQRLIDILNHRSHFGFPYYDFHRAFRKSIGKSTRVFYKEWRKIMNVYYNSVYAQKEEISEFAQKLELPFEYIYDLRISPDSSYFGVVAIQFLDEPIRKLYLVKTANPNQIKTLEQNPVLPGISFTRDSQHIIYAKTHRGEHGSIIPDIFSVDFSGRKKQLSHNLRATTPDCSPVDDKFVCVVNENGTANLFIFDMNSGEKIKISAFTGDVQLSRPRWSPDGKWIAFMQSDTNGQRDIGLLASDGTAFHKLTNDKFDNRNPVWTGNNHTIAFTSYRMGIPNLFAKSISSINSDSLVCSKIWQITDAAQGLYLLDCLDSTLAVLVFDSKKSKAVYQVNKNRTTSEHPIAIRSRYEKWRNHRPPYGIPDFQPADSDSIQIVRVHSYNSFKNISHYFTVPVPYVDEDHYGASLITYWAEPLGKHNFIGLGDFILNNFPESQFIFSYLNNQFHPSIQLSFFQYPLEAQWFEKELLIEEHTGVAVNVSFPFNFGKDFYSNNTIHTQFKWWKNKPLLPDLWGERFLRPESKQIGEITFGYFWRKQPPYQRRVIHPLRSKGVKLQVRVSDRKWNSQLTYQHYNLDCFTHIPLNRLLHVLYGRFNLQALTGKLQQQHQLGFDKYDQLDFGFNLPLGDRERLRGIHEYLFGNRLILSNLEYRIPLIMDLGWYVAGFEFGQVTGALFLDWGAVWNNKETSFSKISFLKTSGWEFKNTINLAGLKFVHSMGLAWNLSQPQADASFYYRIRGVVPF
jgi:hypothetical protein